MRASICLVVSESAKAQTGRCSDTTEVEQTSRAPAVSSYLINSPLTLLKCLIHHRDHTAHDEFRAEEWAGTGRNLSRGGPSQPLRAGGRISLMAGSVQQVHPEDGRFDASGVHEDGTRIEPQTGAQSLAARDRSGGITDMPVSGCEGRNLAGTDLERVCLSDTRLLFSTRP